MFQPNDKTKELEKGLGDVKRLFSDLKKDFSNLKNVQSSHKHTGNDGSAQTTGDSEAYLSKLTLGGGNANRNVLFPSLTMIDSDVLKNTKTSRASILAVETIATGTSTEQINSFIGSALNTDVSESNPMQLSQARLIYSPQSTDRGFFVSETYPIVSGQSAVTNGSNTFTDTTKNWKINELAGAILTVSSLDAGWIDDGHYILSNTANTITLVNSETIVATSGQCTYIVTYPTYLGYVATPWRRLYVVGTGIDTTQAQRKAIRFGLGSSSGPGVIWIAYGTGSPEGVVTANVGSLYLRTDGSTGTVLYVKEVGTTSAGWALAGGYFKAYGDMYLLVEAGSALGITTVNTAVQLSSLSETGLGSGMTFQGNTELLTVTTGTYLVTWCITMSCAAAGKKMLVYACEDNTSKPQLAAYVTMSVIGAVTSASASGLVSLTAGKVLNVRVENRTDGTDVNLHSFSLTAKLQ